MDFNSPDLKCTDITSKLYLLGLSKQVTVASRPETGNYGGTDNIVKDRLATCSLSQNACQAVGEFSANAVNLLNNQLSHSGTPKQADHVTEAVQLDVIKKQMEEQAEIFAHLRVGVFIGFSWLQSRLFICLIDYKWKFVMFEF